MDRLEALSRLRARERDLRALGLKGLSLFGSTARGEGGPASDVDLAATFDPAARINLFSFAMVREKIGEILGARIDLIAEPSRKPRFQAEIDRDRVRVF